MKNSRSGRFRYWPGWISNDAPFVKILLDYLFTGLLISGAFAVGVFNSLGAGIVPLIDKGNLILTVGIFASGVYVFSIMYARFFQILFYYNPVFVTFILILFSRRYRRWRNREFSAQDLYFVSEYVRRKNSHAYIIASVSIGISVFFITGFVGSSGNFEVLYKSMQVDGMLFLGFLAIISLLMLAIYFLGVSSARSSLMSFSSIGFRAIIIFVSLLSGSTWINWIRDVGPRSIISYQNGDRDLVAIAFPAIEGLIVFVDGSHRATYMPWSNIDRAQPVWQTELEDIRAKTSAQIPPASISPSSPTSLK